MDIPSHITRENAAQEIRSLARAIATEFGGKASPTSMVPSSYNRDVQACRVLLGAALEMIPDDLGAAYVAGALKLMNAAPGDDEAEFGIHEEVAEYAADRISDLEGE